jgi:hypothetical protein
MPSLLLIIALLLLISTSLQAPFDKYNKKIAVNRGIPYPVEQKVIDDLQNATASYNYKISLRRSRPFAEFIAFRLQPERQMDWSDARVEASRSIFLWAPFLNISQNDPTVCFKAFQDFDLVFLSGILDGNVHMKVAHNRDNGAEAWATLPGYDGARASITYNDFYINRTSPYTVSKLLAILLHEMTHAYFDITSTFDKDITPGGGHGVSYWIALRGNSGVEEQARVEFLGLRRRMSREAQQVVSRGAGDSRVA